MLFTLGNKRVGLLQNIVFFSIFFKYNYPVFGPRDKLCLFMIHKEGVAWLSVFAHLILT